MSKLTKTKKLINPTADDFIKYQKKHFNKIKENFNKIKSDDTHEECFKILDNKSSTNAESIVAITEFMKWLFIENEDLKNQVKNLKARLSDVELSVVDIEMDMEQLL
jgi:hypothetical protein